MSEAFQPGFGALLKAGREEKNLAVADVAAKLKLTGRQVEALEAEDLSHLPSEVFVRGFVRNYARLVDVDVDSVIAPVDVQAAVAETITAPSAGVTFNSKGIRRWVVLPLAALGVFLLLVAALYHWLRQGEDSLVVAEPVAPVANSQAISQPNTQPITQSIIQPNTQPNTQPLPATPAPEPAATSLESRTLQLSPRPEVVPDGAPAPAQPNTTRPAPTDSASSALPLPPAKPVASPAPAVALTPAGLPAPAAATAPVAEKTTPAKPAGAHTLRFEPAHDAWIQVVDGKGNRFSRLVRAGSAESFLGEPPFRLVVGEAARVRMSYDGHVIDLTPFIGQKVARLTLE
jgi:cytoskeleton protein RodZ